MKQFITRVWISFLTLSLLLSLAACGGKEPTAATTMHLKRTEGAVAVSDGEGADVPVLDNLGLYSGYGACTDRESYAWIDLDNVKLTKMDQNSEIAIEKDEKNLEIKVRSGSLFFNVTEPLKDDEAMNIRTSTMLVGIRGTCGWVEELGNLSRVYLLEGKVECSAGEHSITVNAGEMGSLTEDGELTVTEFTFWDIPDFVLDEIEEDEDLVEDILDASGLDLLNPPKIAGYRINHTDLETDAPLDYYFERPIFDEITPAYRTINAFFDDLETEFFNGSDKDFLVQSAREYFASWGAGDGASFLNGYTAEVTTQSESYVSVVLDYDWWAGGVTDYGRYGYTFSTETGELLSIRDFINASDAEIVEMTRAELQNYPEGAIWFDSFDRISLDDYHFWIQDGAVQIAFNKYEIATGAAGAFTVTLPAPLKLN